MNPQRPLPPFDSLVAFAAALRHGSMTAAAAELGLTQSAVSHRLRRLETFMGAPLLLRRRAGLAPTPAGTALADSLEGLFDDMAALRDRCRAATAPGRLRVGVGAALAHHWLVRRLPAFAKKYPGIDVELVIYNTLAQAEARSGELDIRVRWMKPEDGRNSSTQRLLFREQVFPVCAPSLLKSAPLKTPAQIAALPLLLKSAEGGHGKEKQGEEWEWSTWFRRLGIATRPKAALRMEELGTAVSAALEGAGVALARSLIVHDALAEGRLVRVLSPRWDMESQKAHVAVWPARLSGDTRVRAFVSWLAAEAEATIAQVSRGQPLRIRKAG